MAINPKKHYVTAVLDASAGLDAAQHVLKGANIPNDAIITETVLYTYVDVAGSSSTLQFMVGESGNTTNDKNITATIAEASFADESVQVVVDKGVKTVATVTSGDAVPLVVKCTVGTAALTAGKVLVTIGYFLNSAIEA